MVKTKVYVEGGGDKNPQKREFREGFIRFLEKAGLKGNMPSIVACGSRNGAYNKFRYEYTSDDDVTAFLLVDSEGPVSAPATAAQPWQHLQARDGWERPPGATDGQCHLMVQMMESWFLADPDAVSAYYGQGFHMGSLPQNPRVEQVSRRDVEEGLNRATRNTVKGRYNKGKHSFDLLERLAPAKVTNASPYAKRFIDALTA